MIYLWRTSMRRNVVIALIAVTAFLSAVGGVASLLATDTNSNKMTPVTIADGGGGRQPNGNSWGG